MRRHYLLLLPVIVVRLACAQTPSQAGSPLSASEVFRQSRPALVEVYSCDSSGQCGYGSGVIVSATGVIVSNAHVLGTDSASATVKLANGDVYREVTLLETNEEHDLSVLKVRAVDLPHMELANSDSLQVGAIVYALGNPRHLEATFSQGMVSSIRRGEELAPAFAGERLIQFTAPISPGNSGGPLIDETGRVIGLVTMGRGDGQNLNFAVPSNYIRAMLAEPRQTSVRQLTSMPVVERSPASASSTRAKLSKNQRLYISSQNDPTSVAEITKKLLKFGRVDLVGNSKEADLVLVVTQTSQLNMTSGAGYQSSAVLTDAQSGVQLWAETKGGGWSMSGFSSGRVGRLLGDELVKFLTSYVPPK